MPDLQVWETCSWSFIKMNNTPHVFFILFSRALLSVLAGVAMMIKVGLNSRQIREAVAMFFKIAPVMLDLMSLVLVMM